MPIICNIIQQNLQNEQQKQKDCHDEKLKKIVSYQIDDQVLYYKAMLDKQWSGKLDPKWKGPYYIHDIIGNGAYKIRELNGKVLKTPVNGSLLKIYINRVDIDWTSPLFSKIKMNSYNQILADLQQTEPLYLTILSPFY